MAIILRRLSKQTSNTLRSVTYLSRNAGRGHFSTVGQTSTGNKEEMMSIQMVEYARDLKNKKDDASYVEAIRVLEQGLSFLKESGPAISTCRVLFTIASFHADRGNYDDAIESLKGITSTRGTPLEIMVSALEAMICMSLQLHQDDVARGHLHNLTELIGTSAEGKELLHFRKDAMTALLGMTSTQYGHVKWSFGDDLPASTNVDTSHIPGKAAATLAYAEYAHLQQLLSRASELYNKCIDSAKQEIALGSSFGLTPLAISPDEVYTAALANLGQLSTDMGLFDEAEARLTDALKRAEEVNGASHPRVGTILACMADLYTRKARHEGSGFFLAEGLYRRSLQLLEGANACGGASISNLDVICLLKAEYADILSTVKERESEASKYRSWAETAWKSARPLDQIINARKEVKKSEDTRELVGKPALTDIRLGRVLYYNV